MNKIYQNIKQNWFFSLLPFLPLFEALFFYPKNNFKVEGDTFPFLQGISVIVLLFASRKYNFRLLTFLLILIICNILILSDSYKLSYIIVFTLALLIVSQTSNVENLYNKLKVFVLSYSFISIAIYFSRLFSYSFDLIRTRGGSNIYGSNELTGLLLLMMLYSLIGKYFRRNDFLIFFGLYTFLGMIFIRRVTLVTSIIIFLTMVFTVLYPRLSKINIKSIFFSSIFVLIFYFVYSQFNFSESIIFRFESSVNSSFKSLTDFYEETSSLRYDLWEDGLSAFSDNLYFGIGAGDFKNISFQSTAHSLSINNFSEFGFFLGGLLNFLLFLPFFKLFFIKAKIRIKVLSIICFFSYLLLANISGINLFQNSGYISGFSTIGFFFLIRLTFSNHKKN